MAAKRKCECGCGQAPAETTRLRKASCPCGASVIRLSRQALSTVRAECTACGLELTPDCLIDATYTDDAEAARAALETLCDRRAVRNAATSIGRRPMMYRCGDCSAIRAAHGPCKRCGSDRDPTTTYMHPRAARIVGGDMPF